MLARCLLGLALTGVLLGGCTRGPTVKASYEVPATVPLRSYPRLLVTSGHDPLEITLAQELVIHLSPEVQVQRVDRDRLERMRQAGEIRAATLVTLVEVRLRRDVEVRTTSRPETVCGPSGCYNRTRYDDYDVPILHAVATLTVYDGPTARILQRVSLEATERGRTWEQMRGRVLVRLLDDVRRLVDARPRLVEVKLLPVDLPGVEAALREMEAGRWREGRVALERVARSPASRALDRSARARLLYDLGIARRFDPVSAERDPEAHFDAAEEALRRAIALDPRERYADALTNLRAHERATLDVRRQREATERNFALERQADPTAVAPAPPPGYDSMPPTS